MNFPSFVSKSVFFSIQSKRTGVPSGTDETPRRQLPREQGQQVQRQVPQCLGKCLRQWEDPVFCERCREHRRGYYLPPRTSHDTSVLSLRARGYCGQLRTLTTTATVIFLYVDGSQQLGECFAFVNMWFCSSPTCHPHQLHRPE